ncbi:6-phosphogluconolactonase [Candidatus Curtissbacteria bacterium]|nr:6-phosphogluconolactonase [Candidatus Curtissbacteria bacterium]
MIELVKVKDRDEGNLRAHDFLKEVVDDQTLLALSGGTSPDYRKMIATTQVTEMKAEDTEQKAEGTSGGQGILPGAICVVDERYGKPYHQNSNELLLKNAGIIDYCDLKNIEFHKILEGRGIEQTAEDYDQLMSELFVKYPKKIGVMGIGANLHTAGLFPKGESVKSAKLVTFETVEDQFPQRISLTLKAFGEFGNFIIFAFGEEKKEALRKMLDEKENDMQKYPAIFFRKAFAKSWLVTDIVF